MPDQLMPTSIRRLREIAADRKLDTRAAEERLGIAEQRQLAAEEAVERAERGVAPAGFYLVDGDWIREQEGK